MSPDSDRVVLVVEDDVATGQLVTEAINDEPGYRALHAASPTRALAVLEELVPDVLVVDLNLPEISGLDLYHSVRENERTRQVPVIFQTADGPSHADEMRRLGVAFYVSKPFDLWELVGYVKRLAPRRPFSPQTH